MKHHIDCGLLYDDGPERCTCREDRAKEQRERITQIAIETAQRLAARMGAVFVPRDKGDAA